MVDHTIKKKYRRVHQRQYIIDKRKNRLRTSSSVSWTNSHHYKASRMRRVAALKQARRECRREFRNDISFFGVLGE
jgi:hypothetical protein